MLNLSSLFFILLYLNFNYFIFWFLILNIKLQINYIINFFYLTNKLSLLYFIVNLFYSLWDKNENIKEVNIMMGDFIYAILDIFYVATCFVLIFVIFMTRIILIFYIFFVIFIFILHFYFNEFKIGFFSFILLLKIFYIFLSHQTNNYKIKKKF